MWAGGDLPQFICYKIKEVLTKVGEMWVGQAKVMSLGAMQRPVEWSLWQMITKSADRLGDNT